MNMYGKLKQTAALIQSETKGRQLAIKRKKYRPTEPSIPF